MHPTRPCPRLPARRRILALAGLAAVAASAAGCSALTTMPADASPMRRLVGAWERDVPGDRRVVPMRFDADGQFREDGVATGQWRLDGDLLLLGWGRAIDEPFPANPERWRILVLDGERLKLQRVDTGAVVERRRAAVQKGLLER